jgi:hypothetical protein
MRYLFPSFGEAYNHEAASRVGFTHLLGDAKRDPTVARRLEQRTEQEDSSFYRHCLQLSRHTTLLLAPLSEDNQDVRYQGLSLASEVRQQIAPGVYSHQL